MDVSRDLGLDDPLGGRTNFSPGARRKLASKVSASSLPALLLIATAMLIAGGGPQVVARLTLAMLALVLGAAAVSHATALQAERVHERPDEVWRA